MLAKRRFLKISSRKDQFSGSIIINEYQTKKISCNTTNILLVF